MLKKCLSFILVASMLMAMSTGAACATKPDDITETSKLQDCLNSGVSVIVVGDYPFTSEFTTGEGNQTEEKTAAVTIDYRDMIINVDSLATLPNTRTSNSGSSDNLTAVVISQEAVDSYITQGDEKAALDALLNVGSVAYFPETSYEDMSDIFEAIAGDPFNMTPAEENNTDQVTAYVFKDSEGNFYTGNIIAPENVDQKVIDARILIETRENYDNVYKVGRSTGDFDPGYEWNQLSSWHKNSFAGEDTGVVWLSEWICFYSTQTTDGDHYYAWAGEWCMEPYENDKGIRWRSDYVKYESECSGLQEGIQLRDYWPQSTPSQTTGSISLGVNNDLDYDFGLSYEWQIDDLEFTDNSRPSQEYCRLQWDFNRPIFGDNEYATEVSYAKFAMIFKDTLKEGSYIFHHYRNAYLYSPNVWGESAGANYNSTYDFEP